jgi:hypothetical protein
MKKQRVNKRRLEAVPAPPQGSFSLHQRLSLSIFNYKFHIPPPPQNLPEINALPTGFGGLYASRRLKR